jgi:glycosyltransferase involved in cell wall biosynthesis
VANDLYRCNRCKFIVVMNEKREFTILRFAHAFASGGGMETYLEDLDRTLLSRNPWTIIRMYLTSEKPLKEPSKEVLGRGVLIRIPLYAEQRGAMSNEDSSGSGKPVTEWFRKHLRDQILYNPLLYGLIFRRIVQRRAVPRRDFEATGAGEVAAEVMDRQNTDLLVMHYTGGQDSAAIIGEAVKRNIPYVIINHFSNDRLNHLSVREQTMKAAAIGGVSNVRVPRRLKKGFVNLSDGVDTGTFRRKISNPISEKGDVPIVFLPARITPTKGQSDLIKAYAAFRDEGIRMTVALAGRADSEGFIRELKGQAEHLGIEQDVLFLGELSPTEMRGWYAAASVLAFPTYHHEGLPRVLIESQAMKVPPISYIVGGTPEAIVDGQTGFLVRKGDIRGLKNRLRELVTNGQIRQTMGEAARKFVEEHFSLEALASRHEKFYRDACAVKLEEDGS